MTRLFLLAVFCLINNYATFSQVVKIGGTEGNRPLTWNDFTGTPQDEVSYFAYTHYYINFKYSSVHFNNDTAALDGLVVTLEFMPNSWVKPNRGNDDLLKHEQGHFDIGNICMWEVLDTLKHSVFFKTYYREAVNNLFKTTMQKYNTMELLYDEETSHGLYKKQQKEWNLFIKEHLHQNQL